MITTLISANSPECLLFAVDRVQEGRTLNNEVGFHGSGGCVKVGATKCLITHSRSLVRPGGELGPSQGSIRSPVPACATSSSDIRRSLPTFFVSKVQRCPCRTFA